MEKISTAPPTKEELRLMEIDDKIDNYIFGRMTAEEEKSFLEECKTNDEIRHRAKIIALLVNSIRK